MTRHTTPPAPTGRTGIDRFLRWGLLVTLVLVIAALIYGTVRVYQGQPPISERVVAPNGTVLYTRDDILDGKMIFQRTDLMDFGSLYGNGAYFGVGIEFEEAPLPAGHAFFHGEKEPKSLEANVVLSIGNCGLYTGPWGVRVEDTTLVGVEGPKVLTGYPRSLAIQ